MTTIREGNDKKGRKHFYVDYSEQRFQEDWMRFMVWGFMNTTRGHTYDQTFAQFQTKEDAQNFIDFFMVQ